MTIQKNKLFLVILLQFFRVCVLASDETNELKMEIKAYSSIIKIGEPLISEIRAISKTPNINPDTGEIITSGEISSPYLIITKKGQKEEMKYEYDNILNKPLSIVEKGKKGLEYTGYFIAFYDQNKKGLLFDEPGEYSCRFESARDKLESNTIEITVKPADKQEEKAISILTGKDDLMILGWSLGELDLKDVPNATDILDRFKQVVEQCPDTMIAKMAAAQVGFELYSEYGQLRQITPHDQQDSLFEARQEASKYLKIGTKLPEGFTIRENILHSLIAIEFYEKNYLQAISYLEKIYEEFPYGRFGKSAHSGIEEVKTMMANDPNWTNRAITKEIEKEQSPKKPLGVALPITGAAVAVIAITGLILLTRKKKLEK